jgi:hypothetical protein
MHIHRKSLCRYTPLIIISAIPLFDRARPSLRPDPEERLVALKFLLHFVGDLHQPLHSSDNHDRGGNQIKVVVDGFEHTPRDELHAYWDTQFVRSLGRSPKEIAQQLMDKITPENVKMWSAGTPDDWSMEAFKLSKADVYGDPPLTKNGVQHLDAEYVDRAGKDVALQLSRAGVRLAAIHNKALSSTKGAAPSTSTSTTAMPTKPNELRRHRGTNLVPQRSLFRDGAAFPRPHAGRHITPVRHPNRWIGVFFVRFQRR